jgi:hypothetical protein
MRRAKPQPIRNKIDLADPAQIRAWTRRLGITADDLRRVAGKVGNSIAAVSKRSTCGNRPRRSHLCRFKFTLLLFPRLQPW